MELIVGKFASPPLKRDLKSFDLFIWSNLCRHVLTVRSVLINCCGLFNILRNFSYGCDKPVLVVSLKDVQGSVNC